MALVWRVAPRLTFFSPPLFLQPYNCTPLFYNFRKKVVTEHFLRVRPAGPPKNFLVEGPGLRGGENFEKGGRAFFSIWHHRAVGAGLPARSSTSFFLKKRRNNFWVRPAGPRQAGPQTARWENFFEKKRGGRAFFDLAPPRSGWSSTKNFLSDFLRDLLKS